MVLKHTLGHVDQVLEGNKENIFNQKGFNLCVELLSDFLIFAEQTQDFGNHLDADFATFQNALHGQFCNIVKIGLVVVNNEEEVVNGVAVH